MSKQQRPPARAHMMRLLLDTNIIIDYLNERDPFYEKARLLMIAGRLGEFELWISSSQVTDIIYILSDGGRASQMQDVLKTIRGLRTFVNVYAAGEREVDAMLATTWADPEDALLFEIALKLKADAIISRNKSDFESNLVPVLDAAEFFAWFSSEYGIDYAVVEQA